VCGVSECDREVLKLGGGGGPLGAVAPFKKYVFRQGLIITENREQFFVDHDVYSCIRD
jgi:hypothetical protein